MSDRDAIFDRIRKALDPLSERAAYPEWEDDLPLSQEPRASEDDWEQFAHKFKQVNGDPVMGLEALGHWLKEHDLTTGYCDPAVVEPLRALSVFEGITLRTDFDRTETEIDSFAFGITRASGLIAETGTVILKDHKTSSRLAALAPWSHIALVRREEIHPNVMSAIRTLGDDPSIIWCTGPSKTADVEGILIEGVHGPGVQVACLMD